MTLKVSELFKDRLLKFRKYTILHECKRIKNNIMKSALEKNSRNRVYLELKNIQIFSTDPHQVDRKKMFCFRLPVRSKLFCTSDRRARKPPKCFFHFHMFSEYDFSYKVRFLQKNTTIRKIIPLHMGLCVCECTYVFEVQGIRAYLNLHKK